MAVRVEAQKRKDRAHSVHAKERPLFQLSCLRTHQRAVVECAALEAESRGRDLSHRLRSKGDGSGHTVGKTAPGKR